MKINKIVNFNKPTQLSQLYIIQRNNAETNSLKIGF